MDINKPSGILLDLDNTLYPYQPAHEVAIGEVYQLYRSEHPVTSEEFYNIYDNARKSVRQELLGQASSHNRLLYFQRMQEMTGRGLQAKQALKLYHTYWNTFVQNICIANGVLKFLEYCQTNQIKVAICTDLTVDVQMHKISHLSLDHFLSAVVTSEEAGVEKPDLRIFQQAMRKLKLQANDVWVIGDDLAKDIAGGRAAGCATVWAKQFAAQIKPAEDNPIIADMTINSFDELIPLIEKS